MHGTNAAIFNIIRPITIRYIFGRDPQLYQLQKKVFNQCHLLLFVQPMTYIYQPRIHVYLDCIYHYIQVKQSCATNCCSPSKTRTSALFKKKQTKSQHTEYEEVQEFN